LREALRIDPSDSACQKNYVVNALDSRRAAYQDCLMGFLIVVAACGLPAAYYSIVMTCLMPVLLIVLMYFHYLFIHPPDFVLVRLPFHWFGFPRITLP
jgi:hypothetical protein